MIKKLKKKDNLKRSNYPHAEDQSLLYYYYYLQKIHVFKTTYFFNEHN